MTGGDTVAAVTEGNDNKHSAGAVKTVKQGRPMGLVFGGHSGTLYKTGLDVWRNAKGAEPY
jgi:hypothetical protein